MSRSAAPAARIRVLHVGKYFPPFAGGMEHFLADLLGALARRGVQGGAVVHDHETGSRGETRDVAVPGPGAGGGEAADVSFRLYRVPAMGRLLYAPVSPRFPVWLRRAIRAERPDILHLHLPNTSAFWALMIPEARRIPWVVHWHADVVASAIDRRLKLAYPLYRPFEQRLLAAARRVIATSPDYLNASPALRPWRDKCCVVPLGIDAARIPDPSDESRREAEQLWGDAGFRILSVGRLTYYKGHEHLVRAARALPAARVLLVGEGERRPVLEKLISDSGLGERVVLAGGLAGEALHALMASCDCFCLPSVERTEAFGMVLIEAMAHGKAVVVCDIAGSGVRWVVREGETGRVVPPSNPRAMAETLAALSRQRADLSRMGSAGRRRYEALFDMEGVCGRILELYSRMVSQRGCPTFQ